MSKVSVIIPARKEPYLDKTVADLYVKAAGEIEVIVVLDGWQPEMALPEYPGLQVIRHLQVKGMRYCINGATNIASGEFLMKIDAHCTVGEGWDEILKADCADNWIVIPRRYWLDAPDWQITEQPHVDAMAYVYPFKRPYAPKLTCRPWPERANLHREILIDEDMGFQGSLWFMTAGHFKRLGGLSETGYGTFAGEPEELGLKTQLGPCSGKVIRNKKTWYAHWSKPNSHWRTDPEIAGRVSDEERLAGWKYTFDFWWHNRWPERARDFEWLVEKFWPIPEWPDDWHWRSEQYKRFEFERVSA